MDLPDGVFIARFAPEMACSDMIQTLSDALTERGYETLTDVQQAVTNPDIQNSDLLVSAQTGSGKTVGFGLAIAPTLLGDAEVLGNPNSPIALVIAPTRELALQVMRELRWLYAKAGAKVVSCVGGMDMRDERRALDRGAHIVVGTPGRLRDHIQRGSLDMDHLRAIVLDEADEMLDLGFREDLEFMLDEAPEDRRTLLFSATVPAMIAKLAKQFQRDAVRITTISEAKQHADISYHAVRVSPRDSENAIINILQYHDAQNAIVFANTRAMVNRLTARFANRGFAVVALSGELSQTERTHALQAMRDGRARVCVATDVAARGIDLPKLELVIHAELPSNSEGLLHRSGRTGRAGRKGISTLIIPPKLAKKAERLMKFAKIQAEWMDPPTADMVIQRDQERLLSDPIWTDPITEKEQDFVSKLTESHSAEQIAAACLRLHLSRSSAPEELSAPGAKPEPRQHKDFGPSVWFSVSIGRDDRAEPRWLLPLLCRAGNIDKDAIGAIRIQQSESFVELTEKSVDGFLAAIGPKATLEEGVTVRKLDKAPNLSNSPRPSSPRKPSGGRGDKPAYGEREKFGGKRKPKEFDAKPADRKPRKHDIKPDDINAGRVKPRPAKSEKPAASDKPKKGSDYIPNDRNSDPKQSSKPRKAAKAGAGDPSKRFSPKDKPAKGKAAPGKRAPKRKPAGFGGSEPPRRSKK